MPVKNSQPFLEECLTSIRAQTYADWQLIAVDDHSSDDSPAILKATALLDERIKVIQNEGNGIIDALSSGYAISNGDFITRMDADDIMPKDKLQHMLNHLPTAGDPALVTGKVEYLDDGTLADGYKKYAAWLNHQVDDKKQFKEIYKECVVPSCCWLMSRANFDRLGAFAGLSYPEDYDLCFRCYDAGFKISYADEVVHYWRDHPERTSRTSPVYLDNTFLPLKINWFLKIDYNPTKNLILWGAGKKGKKIAQLLIAQKTPFLWVCNNPKKIGHNIYGQTLHEIPEELNSLSCSQLIIAVADPEAQKAISTSLAEQPNTPDQVFWFS